MKSAMAPGPARAFSAVTRNYRHIRCAAFGLGRGATKEHSRQRSVTEEQRRPRPNATQPKGRQSFFALTSLLPPYRPLAGMLVARASSARKIPCRGCDDNSASQHQFWNTKRGDAIKKFFEGRVGILDFDGNFDIDIHYPFPSAERFDRKKYESVFQRLSLWLGPVGLML